ncbi:sulfotransferase [Pseudooceanicola aestuarii]|uniref:sulfotransferase-like domain-containing protein n=1 Tax=Pseudooceanicola aestuarii TaxID=2697319 RepID=UPI0013D313A8|nr:sulfotransferase [Pseudooceanicola aestuarii]
MRIAAWSGPRNLSTAMMYAFGNRADFTAVDEPFYAAYLTRTGLYHPMREQVLAAQSDDMGTVVADLIAPLPEGRHVYHKHMAQHILPDTPLDWLDQCRHLILLRHPDRVISSFAKGYDNVTLADVGFLQLAELFDILRDRGLDPVVVDSADIRRDPEGMLRAICDRLGLDWDPAMLSWPAGPKPADGVWAPHWYAAVHRSTGFAGPEGDLPEQDRRVERIAQAAMPYYDRLVAEKLVP